MSVGNGAEKTGRGSVGALIEAALELISPTARSGSDDAEGAPKKRRRRRSRKPKQDGGDAGASAE